MEIVIKIALAAVMGAVICLLIKKYNPEISAAISIALTVIILLACSSLFEALKELVSCAVDMLGASTTLLRPMMKCLGIAFISRFAADTCRDASLSAAASALELGGTLCSASVAMPVIISMLKMIGTLV